MKRTPPAARRLVDEVTALDAGLEAETFGDPDGYGVYRDVAFSGKKAAVDALFTSLELVEDERIASFHRRERKIYVHFVGDVRADHVDAFDIDAAYKILTKAFKSPRPGTSPEGEGGDDGPGADLT